MAGKSNKARKAAGSASQKTASGKRAASKAAGASPGEYAREAFSEWGKAARFGAAALVASGGGDGKSKSKSGKPPLKERLNPATTQKGGRIGDAADNLLSKMGFLGKAASKLSMGSRAVDKVVPDAVTKMQPGGGGKGKAATENGSGEHPPIPIQESVDLAVPIHSAFALATRFEDFPQWSDRIEDAEEVDDKQVALDLKLRGVKRSLELEITDMQAPLRIEWEVSEGMDAGGMLTFHELAPSLTHLELSLDVEPENPIQRLTRSIHLPDRVIRSELHRFKAWAELWQEVEDVEPPEEPEDEFEDEPEEEPRDELDEEPEDEEEIEEEPEDEFEEEPEDEPEDEPLGALDQVRSELRRREDEFEEEPEDEFEDEPEEEPEDEFEEEPEDEFVDDEDFDEEGEPAGTR